MHSRQQVKVHVNRVLRARTVEHKLDEMALAIAELARYIEEIEKDELSKSLSRRHGTGDLDKGQRPRS